MKLKEQYQSNDNRTLWPKQSRGHGYHQQRHL